MTIIFVVAIPGNAWLWAHFLYQDDVALSYNGTANIHITPKILPPFPLALTINRPIMKAYREYLANTAVQFPFNVCDKCSVDTLVSFLDDLRWKLLVGEDETTNIAVGVRVAGNVLDLSWWTI